jgi:hypothetical protein
MHLLNVCPSTPDQLREVCLEGEALMRSRTAFGAIGPGIGALIESITVDLVADGYGCAGAGIGGLIGF